MFAEIADVCCELDNLWCECMFSSEIQVYDRARIKFLRCAEKTLAPATVIPINILYIQVFTVVTM